MGQLGKLVDKTINALFSTSQPNKIKKDDAKVVEEQGVGRSKIGAFNKRNTSWSKRAAVGKIVVFRKRCPYCYHHKSISNETETRCARCKRELK